MPDFQQCTSYQESVTLRDLGATTVIRIGDRFYRDEDQSAEPGVVVLLDAHLDGAHTPIEMIANWKKAQLDSKAKWHCPRRADPSRVRSRILAPGDASRADSVV